uniref:Uncharacterized protein n=1 Tax=Sphaerodactylus townsendi TaxID=933632 RepID=A0ACB8FHH6_9SAUR
MSRWRIYPGMRGTLCPPSATYLVMWGRKISTPCGQKEDDKAARSLSSGALDPSHVIINMAPCSPLAPGFQGAMSQQPLLPSPLRRQKRLPYIGHQHLLL